MKFSAQLGPSYLHPHETCNLDSKLVLQTQGRQVKSVSVVYDHHGKPEFGAENSPALSFKKLRSKLSVCQSKLDQFRIAIGSKREILGNSREQPQHVNLPRGGSVHSMKIQPVDDSPRAVGFPDIQTDSDKILQSVSQTSHRRAANGVQSMSSRELGVGNKAQIRLSEIETCRHKTKVESRFKAQHKEIVTPRINAWEKSPASCVQGVSPASSLSLVNLNYPNDMGFELAATSMTISEKHPHFNSSPNGKSIRVASSTRLIEDKPTRQSYCMQPSDGPSWFRRSNSTSKTTWHKRAATSVLPSDLLIGEVSNQIEQQENSVDAREVPFIEWMADQSVV